MVMKMSDKKFMYGIFVKSDFNAAGIAGFFGGGMGGLAALPEIYDNPVVVLSAIIFGAFTCSCLVILLARMDRLNYNRNVKEAQSIIDTIHHNQRTKNEVKR